MPKLGVNIDHVATLRQARRGIFPSPVGAALTAQKAGADSIVCHLREDRRHIQDADLTAIKKALRIPLNLEMAASPEIVRIACNLKPYQATLVPERRQELTTEGGLNLSGAQSRLKSAIQKLNKAGIRVSLFIDPTPEAVRRSVALGVPMIELHTGCYAETQTASSRARRLKQIQAASALAHRLGLIVAAGHGLDYKNVKPVAAIAKMEELNIGFSIIAESLQTGLYQAVRKMKQRVQ